jgi:hypothetical protein
MHEEFRKGHPQGCENIYRNNSNNKKKKKNQNNQNNNKNQQGLTTGPGPVELLTGGLHLQKQQQQQQMIMMMMMASSSSVSPEFRPNTIVNNNNSNHNNNHNNNNVYDNRQGIIPSPDNTHNTHNAHNNNNNNKIQQQQQVQFMLTPSATSSFTNVANQTATGSPNDQRRKNNSIGKVPLHSSSDESTAWSRETDDDDDDDDEHSESTASYGIVTGGGDQPQSQPQPQLVDNDDDVLLSFDEYDLEPIPYQDNVTSINGCKNDTTAAIANYNNNTTSTTSLEQLWLNMTSNLESLLEPRRIDSDNVNVNVNDNDVLDLATLLEPRSIQEMIKSNNNRNDKNNNRYQQQKQQQQVQHHRYNNNNNIGWLFDNCPYMTPETQNVVEYMLPVLLPSIMYFFDTTVYGYIWSTILIVGHTVECMFTNFGSATGSVAGGGSRSAAAATSKVTPPPPPSSSSSTTATTTSKRTSNKLWYYRDVLGAIQHMTMDLLWNHAMISWIFFYGPDTFGTRCYPLGLMLIPTLPTMIAVDTKSHFVSCIVVTRNDDDDGCHENDRILKHRMNHHLRRVVSLYVVAMIVLGFSSFYGNTYTQTLAIFYFNACPIITDLSYWKEFGLRLQQLPNKQGTVIHQIHINYILKKVRRATTNTATTTTTTTTTGAKTHRHTAVIVNEQTQKQHEKVN